MKKVAKVCCCVKERGESRVKFRENFREIFHFPLAGVPSFSQVAVWRGGGDTQKPSPSVSRPGALGEVRVFPTLFSRFVYIGFFVPQHALDSTLFPSNARPNVNLCRFLLLDCFRLSGQK